MSLSFRSSLRRAAALGVLALAGRAFYRRMTHYSFVGRTVLITGGSRGLGLVLARQLAGRGARLALCARDPEELERAKADLRCPLGGLMTLPCDITRPDQVASMVEQVERQLGPVDVVVNNAGIIQVGPVETMTSDDYERAMATHFDGPRYVIEAVLPYMRRRGEGRIVNIASIGGRVSVPHLSPYCASKFALVGYSLGLRSELAKDGIYVTTVCPGLMKTGSPRNAEFKGRHRAEHAWFKVSSSLPLVTTAAERAAWQIIYACSHADPYLVVGLPTKLAEKLSSLCPGRTAQLLALVNRLLPSAGGIGTSRLPGFESTSFISQSGLTSATQQAAARNNEISPDQQSQERM